LHLHQEIFVTFSSGFFHWFWFRWRSIILFLIFIYNYLAFQSISSEGGKENLEEPIFKPQLKRVQRRLQTQQELLILSPILRSKAKKIKLESQEIGIEIKKFLGFVSIMKFKRILNFSFETVNFYSQFQMKAFFWYCKVFSLIKWGFWTNYHFQPHFITSKCIYTFMGSHDTLDCELDLRIPSISGLSVFSSAIIGSQTKIVSDLPNHPVFQNLKFV